MAMPAKIQIQHINILNGISLFPFFIYREMFKV